MRDLDLRDVVGKSGATRGNALVAQSRHVLTVVWLILLLCLSYKQKIIGQAAVRPLYLFGVAFGLICVALYLPHLSRSYRLVAGQRGEAHTLLLLLALPAYVTFQTLIFAGSIRPVLYSVAAIGLVLMLCTVSLLKLGEDEYLKCIVVALVWYCVVNVAFLALGVVRPDLVSIVQVSADESGYGARLAGLPGDPTHLGALFSITMMLLFVLRDRFPRSLLILLSIPLLGIVFASGSRNSLLSLLLGCGAALLLEYRISGRVIKATLGLIVASILLGLVIAVDADVRNIAINLFRIDDPNAYSRLRVWYDMLDVLRRVPPADLLAGKGFLYIQGEYGSPYNAFIRLFFNQGLAGIVIGLLGLMMVLMLLLTERNALVRQFAGALLAYWISFSMFLDTFIAEFFHLAEFCLWAAVAILARGVFVRRVDSRPRSIPVNAPGLNAP